MKHGKIGWIKTEQIKNDLKFLKKQWKVIALIVLFVFIFKYVFHGLCMLRILTGFPCPACGMTRAAILFFRGHIGESMKMHPLWPFVLLLLLFFIVCWCCRYVEAKHIEIKQKYLYYICYGYGIALAIALFLLYFYRMYQYFPYEEPMIYYADNVLFRMLVK